jgi:ribosomal protein S27E
MSSSMRVGCPGCDQEFLVSPQFERMKIAAKCPFCEKEFPIEDAKSIARPSQFLFVK